MAKRRTSHKTPSVSSATLNLQQRFSEALATLQVDRTNFSLFVADNLEKLLNQQYEHEKKKKFSEWREKMDELDFQNRTRSFFNELRKKHNTHQKAGPIIDSSGNLSRNFDNTLKNWTKCYKNLYSCKDCSTFIPTSDEDDFLDSDITLPEFLDEIYILKRHKSPGYDGITNEDILSLIPTESPENDIDNHHKLTTLRTIFNILDNFCFNETVPRVFKRTILSPF